MLASGDSVETVLNEYPFLEPEDIQAKPVALPSCLIADMQIGFISPATASVPAAVRRFCENNPVEHGITEPRCA